MKMNKHIVALIKMKDVKGLAGAILRSEGLDEEATELEQAGRLTVALIDRTCVAVDADEPEGEEVSNDPEREDDKVAIADEPETVDHEYKAIRKAIKKGKGKKAMKLIVEAREAGARGSVLKDLTKQAEAL